MEKVKKNQKVTAIVIAMMMLMTCVGVLSFSYQANAQTTFGGVTVSNITSNSAKVSWPACKSGKWTAKYYTVVYKKASAKSWTKKGPILTKGRSYKLTKLSKKTKYNVYIIANSDNGKGCVAQTKVKSFTTK